MATTTFKVVMKPVKMQMMDSASPCYYYIKPVIEEVNLNLVRAVMQVASFMHSHSVSDKNH